MDDRSLTRLFERMDAHLAQQDAYLAQQDVSQQELLATLRESNAELAEATRMLAETRREVEASGGQRTGAAGLLGGGAGGLGRAAARVQSLAPTAGGGPMTRGPMTNRELLAYRGSDQLLTELDKQRRYLLWVESTHGHDFLDVCGE